MNTLSTAVACFFLVPLAMCIAIPPARAAEERRVFATLRPEHQALLATWLVQDCRVGAEAEEIQAYMIEVGPIFEAALWEAYELGPTEQERADLQNALGDRFALRNRWLLTTLSEVGELGAQVLAESEEEFRMTEELKQFDRWRDAAIGGLGLVCTEQSLERLHKIAADREHPSSIAAQVALKTSASCRGR